MRAFDSIKMGWRCKAWLLQSDVPPAYTSVISSGPSAQSEQWIVNAIAGGRGQEVMDGSAVVLDGGPRWVLSTALGFVTGGLCLTYVFTTLFALGNYAIYVNTASGPSISGDEAAGIIAYMILAAAISMASVPGAWFVAGVSGCKDLACGLVVELLLCFSVVVSAATVHSFLGPFVAENPGLSPYVHSGRWISPALVWMVASKLRAEATKAVEIKLAGLWCCHPIAVRSTSVSKTDLWDDWSANVRECASRVGGYGMLGFSASDLAVLAASSPSTNALKEIQKLRSCLSTDVGTTKPWIRQSLAFMAGYDSRLRITGPESACPTIPLGEIQTVVRDLILRRHPKVDTYQTEIEKSYDKAKYLVNTEEDDPRWFYAGALIADSDQRTGSVARVGEYGSRLAVSLALLVEGTDPLARLACYDESKLPRSSVSLLSWAISSSTKALVEELADCAGVTIVENSLGVRGLAYATGSKTPKRLAYSPHEMVAASRLEEAIVISDDTFSAGSPEKIFEKLWGGSANVDKRVDVSDMVPLAASAPEEAGWSACLGWICHVGFTLAVVTTYLSGSTSTGFVALFLVVVPSTDKKVSVHLSNHFHMVYISSILNYARFVSRLYSPPPRGQASIQRAKTVGLLVSLFVNILPVVAYTVLDGWKCWVAFSPCILSSLPGLLHTIWYGWASAFKYEWWSWHALNRLYSGSSYLKCVDLRKRVGRTVLSFNNDGGSMEVKKVLPLQEPLSSHPSGVRFMVVGD